MSQKLERKPRVVAPVKPQEPVLPATDETNDVADDVDGEAEAPVKAAPSQGNGIAGHAAKADQSETFAPAEKPAAAVGPVRAEKKFVPETSIEFTCGQCHCSYFVSTVEVGTCRRDPPKHQMFLIPENVPAMDPTTKQLTMQVRHRIQGATQYPEVTRTTTACVSGFAMKKGLQQ